MNGYTEDFGAGIRPERWDVFRTDAQGAPWSIQAPDATGALQISKPQDAAPLLPCPLAGVESRFTLIGDFSVFVDFRLVTFPPSPTEGAADAILSVSNGSTYFECLKQIYRDAMNSQAFMGLAPQTIAVIPDPTAQGRLGITRSGQTLSAWIDRGSGPSLIGAYSSAQFLGPMTMALWLIQQDGNLQRPHSALDVRFDNVMITADVIVPEPATLGLLALGSFAIMRRRSH